VIHFDYLENWNFYLKKGILIFFLVDYQVGIYLSLLIKFRDRRWVKWQTSFILLFFLVHIQINHFDLYASKKLIITIKDKWWFNQAMLLNMIVRTYKIGQDSTSTPPIILPLSCHMVTCIEACQPINWKNK